MPTNSGGGSGGNDRAKSMSAPNPTKEKMFPRQIEPVDHFGYSGVDEAKGLVTNTPTTTEQYETNIRRVKQNFLIPPEYHFVKDDDGTISPEKSKGPFLDQNNVNTYQFTGATTNVNREKSPDKQAVMDYGLENAELNRVNNAKPEDTTYSSERYDPNTTVAPPLSPIHPFTRLNDPKMAQSLNVFAYNRFHYPIADLEHRKSFRNLFFTRPECYIYCTEGKLSQQCELDDTFASANSRIPHVLKLLSPVYVTGSIGPNSKILDNINYMVSNRANGFSVTEETLSVQETLGKSIEGYTVTEGMHLESHQGGTVSVTFTDTKYLEIYEYHRLWMNYIYKRRKGTFEPPFSKYAYTNDFPVTFGDISAKDKAFYLHPYDRALEYTCSMFDLVTNEANDRITYWCKYYGLFPISVSIDGLNNDNGAPMVDRITVNVTYRYQYKLPCENKALVEFNFNTGITDLVGGVNQSSFDASTGYINTANFKTMLDSSIEDPTKSGTNHSYAYQGGAGMFVGTPYIVMGRFNRAPDRSGHGELTVHPFLRFMPITDTAIENVGNLGISGKSTLDSFNSVMGTDGGNQNSLVTRLSNAERL